MRNCAAACSTTYMHDNMLLYVPTIWYYVNIMLYYEMQIHLVIFYIFNTVILLNFDDNIPSEEGRLFRSALRAFPVQIHCENNRISTSKYLST